jgi:hypothetical protein
MSDEVGVDPQRVAQVATALEQLRDTLAANVPVIVNTLNQYWSGGTGSAVDLSPLRRAQARSVQDAADMRARANLAAAFMANPVNIDIVASGMAWIPWSGPALDQADAQLDAQALTAVVDLAHKDPAAARAALAGISQDLSDHSSDAAFLKAFWSQPGVAAAAANLASVLQTSQHGAKVNGPSKSDLNSVLAVLASAAIPLGFADKYAYMAFNSSLMNGLARAGYPNAVAVFQGSSVTGIRFRTRELVGDNPNDYDVAVCDPDLYNAAKDIGVGLRNDPARTGPLSEDQATELGLRDLQVELSGQAGRQVNIVLYEDPRAALQFRPGIRVPFAYQVENYFNKQAQKAAQLEMTQEVQQIEEETQAELIEEEAQAEAEAEAEAEAIAIADDDE